MWIFYMYNYHSTVCWSVQSADCTAQSSERQFAHRSINLCAICGSLNRASRQSKQPAWSGNHVAQSVDCLFVQTGVDHYMTQTQDLSHAQSVNYWFCCANYESLDWASRHQKRLAWSADLAPLPLMKIRRTTLLAHSFSIVIVVLIFFKTIMGKRMVIG